MYCDRRLYDSLLTCLHILKGFFEAALLVADMPPQIDCIVCIGLCAIKFDLVPAECISQVNFKP